jgi:hypothetical protein
MSVWRTVRGEVAGAWRSLRYDLRRRSDADRRGTTDTDQYGVDLYSIDDLWGDAPVFDDEIDRPPRRLLAVGAFGLLALVGAAGSYLAVVNGLGLLLTDQSARASYPLAAEAEPAPVATGRQAATSRLGYGSPISPTPAPPNASRQLGASASGTPTPSPTTTAGIGPQTVEPTPAPTHSCRCTPAVPIPTLPTIPPYPGGGGRPDGYPPVTVSPSVSVSVSVSASVSASPSPSVSADGYHQGGRGGAGHTGDAAYGLRVQPGY